MNDISIKEQYLDKVNKNTMTEKMRRIMIQKSIQNKYMVLNHGQIRYTNFVLKQNG